MARWTIEQQLVKIDEKITELQDKKKELLSEQKKQQIAAKKSALKAAELKKLKQIKEALDAKGVSPDEYESIIESINH